MKAASTHINGFLKATLNIMKKSAKKLSTLAVYMDPIKGTVAWDLYWLKVMLLDRSVPGEEPLVVFKILKWSFDF